MGSVIAKDVPPYVMVGGHPAKPHGTNAEGLRRRGFDADALAAIKRAYKRLYLSGLKLEQAEAELEQEAAIHPELQPLVAFLRASERSIVR
jgi:UDP-N-acetylglucosamine acyltransferase